MLWQDTKKAGEDYLFPWLLEIKTLNDEYTPCKYIYIYRILEAKEGMGYTVNLCVNFCAL